MVIIILWIRNTSIISGASISRFCQDADARAIDYRLQSHLRKVCNRKLDHAFKSQHVTDADNRFLRQIFARINKTDAVTFGIHLCHLTDHFLRKFCQMLCCTDLVLTNIFSKAIQILCIRKICIFNNILRKISGRIDLVTDPVCRKYITVIAGIPIQDILQLMKRYLTSFFSLCHRKAAIDLQKKFHQDRQVFFFSFKYPGNSSTDFCIQEA